MKSLLKEFAKGDVQTDLKTSDGSDAGKRDMGSKPVDVKFSLMRNMINNPDGTVSGSDVNDYLERAADLNDEVDAVGYAVETDDDQLIKIYVNATQADEFEQELSKMLGLDDDSESAINTLAQKFDIIDVVWPDNADGSPNPGPEDPYAEVTIDDDPSSFLDGTDVGDDQEPEVTTPPDIDPHAAIPADALPADDEIDADSDDEVKDTLPKHKHKSLMKDVDDAADGDTPVDDTTATDDAADQDDGEDLDTDVDKNSDKKDKKSLMKDVAGDDEVSDEVGDEVSDKNDDAGDDTGTADDMADVDHPDEDDTTEPELDAEGKPKKKKPKKEKDVTEEGLELSKLKILAEAARDEVLSHVQKEIAAKNDKTGKYYIHCLVTGGITGRREAPYKKGGEIQYFDQAEAEALAKQLTDKMNGPLATATFKYTPKMVGKA